VGKKPVFLPEDKEIMEIASMCGHSMIGFNFVLNRMAYEVETGVPVLKKRLRYWLAHSAAAGYSNPERPQTNLIRRYYERKTNRH